MSERVEVEYALTVNVEDALSNVQQLERMLFKTLSLARRMGLPDDVMQQIAFIQRLIHTLRTLRLAYEAYQVVAAGLGGFFGLPFLGLGIISAGFAIADLVTEGGY
jgi:hypothetical protein